MKALRKTAQLIVIIGLAIIPILPVSAAVDASFGSNCCPGTADCCNEGANWCISQSCGPAETSEESAGVCTRDGEDLLGDTSRCIHNTDPNRVDPTEQPTEGGEGTSEPEPPVTPTMKINIPTVQLSEAEVSGSTLNLPWIADYILGVYKYAVFAGSILAAVMIMIAGMQWMTAAGNASRVGAAKKRISNAVVGMVLLAGSFLLLETINPQLTLLQPISIEVIDREEFQYVSQEAYAQVTGGPPPPQEELEAMVRAVAEERGIDPCALETIVGKESGWRPDAIGHDENVPRQGVRSRRIFIDSGRRYDGSTFTERSYTERSIRNNDGFDPTNPPDYGMDGRFTHGIGLGQFTILLRGNEMTRCSGGEFGRTFGDRCYTAAELINPQIQMEAAANLYTALASRSCGSATGIEKHRCVFYHYAGSGCSAKVSECRKTKAWAQCAGEAHSERSSCTSWLQESNCSWQAR